MRGRFAASILLGLIPLVALAILLPLAESQQAGKVYRIAFPLNSDENRPIVERFLAQLRQLG
jgi:hypothetical protein